MYSYNPDAFFESDVCNKCNVFAALEARLCELETTLAVHSGANHSLTQAKPSTHDGWMAVPGRKRRNKQKHTGHPPLNVANRFSPLTSTPVEDNDEPLAPLSGVPPRRVTETKITTLVIGSSIMRNVKLKTPGTIVKCIPGARAGDIESNLKLMATCNCINKDRCKDKCIHTRYDKIIIHCGGNDTRLRRSEITKVNVASVCTYAKTMSDSVIFSGPLPNMINDEMYSRMSSFNRWLSRWCPDNNVGFIDNWQTFEGKTGLMGRDGIHPTWDGARLISTNMDKYIK